MKYSYLSIATVFSILFLVACEPSPKGEEDKSQRPSPPRTSSANIDGVMVSIEYSSPAVKGRKIFGELEPYDKLWRTGANEATIFSTNGDLRVNGQMLPKGDYALFTIPTEQDWTIIFNKESNQWGAYNYDPSLDELKITVTPEETSTVTERLLFNVSEGGSVEFAWETARFILQIEPA